MKVADLKDFIKKAAEEGPWAWTEASSIISFIYLWSDRDPQEAKRFTEKLASAYPNNYYYRIIFTESLIRTGKLDDAKKSLHLLDVSIESLTDIQKGWFTGYLNFEWALYHFHSRNHDLAMRYADRAMQTYRAELDIILGEAILLKGKLLDLKGDREGAIRAYEQCMDWWKSEPIRKSLKQGFHSWLKCPKGAKKNERFPIT